jgi:hypothetical protein
MKDDATKIYITVNSQDVRTFLAQGFEVEGVKITMSRPIESDRDAVSVATALRVIAKDEGWKVQD